MLAKKGSECSLLVFLSYLIFTNGHQRPCLHAMNGLNSTHFWYQVLFLALFSTPDATTSTYIGVLADRSSDAVRNFHDMINGTQTQEQAVCHGKEETNFVSENTEGVKTR